MREKCTEVWHEQRLNLEVSKTHMEERHFFSVGTVVVNYGFDFTSQLTLARAEKKTRRSRGSSDAMCRELSDGPKVEL